MGTEGKRNEAGIFIPLSADEGGVTLNAIIYFALCKRNLLISGRVPRSPHLFSPFSNPPSSGASIGDAPRFMGDVR